MDVVIVSATVGETGCCCTILGVAGTISTGAGCLSNEDKMVAGDAFFFASSSSALLRFHASKRSLRCRIFSSSLIAAGGVGCFFSLEQFTPWERNEVRTSLALEGCRGSSSRSPPRLPSRSLSRLIRSLDGSLDLERFLSQSRERGDLSLSLSRSSLSLPPLALSSLGL